MKGLGFAAGKQLEVYGVEVPVKIWEFSSFRARF